MAQAPTAIGSAAASPAPRPCLLVAGDQPVANADDAPRVFGDVLLVRHHDDGVALPREFREERQDFRAGLGVEVAGRLVGQQDGRPVHQRAGDGDALALAAGQLVGPVMDPVGQADVAQGLQRHLPPFLGGHAGVDQGQLDVAQRVGARQQVEGLEDEADLLVADLRQLVVVHLAHLDAVQLVLAAGRACPGSRSGSSAWICPSPTAP